MVDMKFLSASTVMYASRSGWHGPTERGFVLELPEASCTSGGARASVAGALPLRACAHVASLTTIIHRFLPLNAAKYVLGISEVAKDDVG